MQKPPLIMEVFSIELIITVKIYLKSDIVSARFSLVINAFINS